MRCTNAAAPPNCWRLWSWPKPDRKSTRLNSSHANISYAVFCLKKKYVEAALNQLRLEGYQVFEADIARLSPLIHDHINMLGRYSFAMPETVARVELRPLRNPIVDQE